MNEQSRSGGAGNNGEELGDGKSGGERADGMVVARWERSRWLNGSGSCRGERLQMPGQSFMEVAELEAWPEPVNGEKLLDDLTEVVRRFVVLPRWGAETVALWVLHTYAFELRDVSAYLGIESPEKRCGKTTLLSVLSELAHRPVVASNISPSAFFRVIEEMRPSLLIDEADTLLYGNDELRGILNAGYTRKAAFVVRVSQQGKSRQPNGEGEGEDGRVAPGAEGAGKEAARQGWGPGLVKFSCWCPKVMAAIGRLPETLADRCIVIRMHRKTAKEECERLRNLNAGELRRRCARFVGDNGEAIGGARPEIPAELNDRAADIWEPLLALADLAGGGWPELARQAAVDLTASEQESSGIGALLLDLLILFTQHGERMFSRDIVERLARVVDRPWVGKEVTERWLARQLRPYGVKPRTLRVGEEVGKGYAEADLMEVFRRYIPKSEVEALKAEWKTEREAREEGAASGLEQEAESS